MINQKRKGSTVDPVRYPPSLLALVQGMDVA